MQTAGARILREDDQHDMSREAVLLQWERKIEADERRTTRLLEEEEASGEGGVVEELRPTEDTTHDAPRRFERRSAPAASARPSRPQGERRTITITGQASTRVRRSVLDSQIAQPDRIALWAFLLGLFLVAVAAGTAHA